ncbi:hypothetical protein LOZ44_006842 [Ophidiomyces ophidiicola]|nr:hypothetical protein LOZ44_006842 [Ophidiomyces ophidiicola]
MASKTDVLDGLTPLSGRLVALPTVQELRPSFEQADALVAEIDIKSANTVVTRLHLPTRPVAQSHPPPTLREAGTPPGASEASQRRRQQHQHRHRQHDLRLDLPTAARPLRAPRAAHTVPPSQQQQ